MTRLSTPPHSTTEARLMRWRVTWRPIGSGSEGACMVTARDVAQARDIFLLHNPGCVFISAHLVPEPE